jgi:nitroimidazol reductase NimA-like FMN-containing flavoprotein (pyridoxamine 5'-phosphate oxidase superfamily)
VANSRSEAPSERARVKRYHWLADYERKTVEAILDATPLCHVGYVFDGVPYVTPTMQWREGERVYWHGSSASRMLRAADSSDVCLTVSLIDGLVLARSAYNYNVNHRSVMIFGRPEKVADPAEKAAHLRTFVDKVIPGQWNRLRPVKDQELKATTMLSMPITEASAKVRIGQPEDEDEDYDFPVWAGYVPIGYQVSAPVADPRNLPGVEMPAEVLDFRIG